MRLLLDTHTLLWWLDGGKKLTRDARLLIANAENEVFVSAASAWEIALKKSIGKLSAPGNLLDEMKHHNFERLHITFEHCRELENLPLIHRDPFDRILIAQCRVEDLTMITRDADIARYEVKRLPA